tara:strand:- start:339 stop:491 length:153 start_codon:yes stop_codon:yes gene_type:complete
MKYFSIEDIVEAVDIVIGDDGFRSNEVRDVLDFFDYIEYTPTNKQKKEKN